VVPLYLRDISAFFGVQEEASAAFDSRRKLEEQVHELASKLKALQADMAGRVCASA